MEIRLLGPVEASGPRGDVAISAPKERALLALLALAVPHAVSDARLLDELWGTDLPASPANALQKRVSELRRLLGRDRLVRRAGGYALAVDADDVDVHRFDREVSAARGLIASGEHAAGADRLRDALARWRGPALADVADHHFAAQEAVRLDGARLDALEDRIHCDIALGHTNDLAAELTALVAEHPYRERLRGQLMIVLARSGRQVEALRAFDEGRRALREIGLSPGPELRALHAAVLHHEADMFTAEVRPALDAASPVPEEPHDPVPWAATSFVGRVAERATLTQHLAAHRLVTVTGPGGVGKTRLASEAAHELATTSTVWLVELASLPAGHAVAAAVADAVGARAHVGAGATDPALLVTTHLERRSGTLVLDNAEHVVADVARLVARVLARCRDVRVLVTSRVPLRIGGEAQLAIGPLDPADAVRLLVERVTTVRPSAVADPASDAVAHDLCRRLDGLPLAIELAAARARALPLDVIAGRLDDRFGLLTRGDRSVAERHQTLHGAVQWSYDLLSAAERELFETISVFAGGFDLEAATAICTTANDELVVIDTLQQLVEHSLVELRGERYSMLATIREFAAEQLELSGRAERTRRVHAEYFGHVALFAGSRAFSPDQATWLARLEDDHANLRAAIDWAVAAAPPMATAIIAAVAPVWWVRGHAPETRAVLDTVLLRDPAISPGRATALRWASQLVDATGWSRHPVTVRDQVALALRRAREALWTAERSGDRREVGHAHRQIGVALLRDGTYRGRPSRRRSAEHLERSIATFAGLDEPWGVAFAHVIASVSALTAGDLATAAEQCEHAAPHVARSGDRIVAERLVLVRALLAELDGDEARAVALHREGVALSEEIGFVEGVAAHRLHLADLVGADHGDATVPAPHDWHAAPDELALAAIVRSLAGRRAAASGDLRRARRKHLDALGKFVSLGLEPAIEETRETLDELTAALAEPR